MVNNKVVNAKYWRKSNLIKHSLSLAVLSLTLQPPSAHADTHKINNALPDWFDWSASLSSEYADNLHGGASQTSASNHVAYLGMNINADKLMGWTGAQFQITGQVTRNHHVLSEIVGDAQGSSNLEAPAGEQLYEAWYGQKFSKAWNTQIGLIPADNYFDVVDSASLLFNSSFGAEPVWSANSLAPIYPTAGIGAIVTWQSHNLTSRAGIFQADPNDRSSAFKKGQSLLQEFAYQGSGLYKLGFTAYQPHDNSGNLPKSNWSTYASIEQPLGHDENSPTAFFRVGFSPEDKTDVRNDFQTGLLVPGLISSRPNDQFSVGVNYLNQRRGLGNETVYEATYSIAVNQYIAIQPDIQYIDKPSGSLPAATVASIRLNIDI